MIIFLILFAVSLIGLVVLLAGKYVAAKNLSREEFLLRFEEGAIVPFWREFYNVFAAPALLIYREKMRPAAYKEVEKLARRFRIMVLRVECLLLRFSEYVRGKRIINSQNCEGNGHNAHYWEQLNNCKNGIHKEEDEKPA